jgi:hypothetical protein
MGKVYGPVPHVRVTPMARWREGLWLDESIQSLLRDFIVMLSPRDSSLGNTT